MNYQATTNARRFENFPINTGLNGEHACFVEMLQKIHDRLIYMVTKHCKVLFIRFDLRFPKDYYSDLSNDTVSHLFKILKENAGTKKIDFQFMWVREQSREKHQHYHCILLINGSKVQNYRRVLEYISQIWARLLNCNPDGLVDFCHKNRDGQPVENGIMIRRPSHTLGEFEYMAQENTLFMDFDRVFRWASYLCKENQKSNTPHGVRRFGVSQIPSEAA